MDNQVEVTNLKKRTVLELNLVKLGFYIFLIMIFILGMYSMLSLLKAVLAALIISYLLNPIVSFGERIKIPRNYVIAIIFIILTMAMATLIMAIIIYFPSTDTIITWKDSMIEVLDKFEFFLATKYNFVNWDDFFKRAIEKINESSIITNKLPALLSSIAGLSSLLIIIPFCVISFLTQGRELKKMLFAMIPNKYFEISLITIKEVDNIFGSYIRGTILECLAIGIFTSIGFFIIGFPLQIAIITGGIVGIFNAIPYIGPLFGGVIGVVITLLNVIPKEYTSIFGLSNSIFGVVIVIVIVQLLDNVYFKPSIIGKSVNLHPMLVLLGVMAGSNLFGFIGMLAAIPVMAILKVIIITLHKQLKGFQLLSDNIISIISKEEKIVD